MFLICRLARFSHCASRAHAIVTVVAARLTYHIPSVDAIVSRVHAHRSIAHCALQLRCGIWNAVSTIHEIIQHNSIRGNIQTLATLFKALFLSNIFPASAANSRLELFGEQRSRAFYACRVFRHFHFPHFFFISFVSLSWPFLLRAGLQYPILCRISTFCKKSQCRRALLLVQMRLSHFRKTCTESR